jgi:hypothetical protein
MHQVGIKRPALRDSVPSLTPTMQIVAQSLKHVPVQLVVALPGMAVAKIATPAFQEAINLGDQLIDRYERSLPVRELPDSLPSSNHGLGRRPHVDSVVGLLSKRISLLSTG